MTDVRKVANKVVEEGTGHRNAGKHGSSRRKGHALGVRFQVNRNAVMQRTRLDKGYHTRWKASQLAWIPLGGLNDVLGVKALASKSVER